MRISINYFNNNTTYIDLIDCKYYPRQCFIEHVQGVTNSIFKHVMWNDFEVKSIDEIKIKTGTFWKIVDSENCLF